MPNPVRTVNFEVGLQATPMRGANPHWRSLISELLAPGVAELRVVAGDFESGIGDGVGGGVVGIKLAIEGGQPAVLFRERAVEVPAQAQGDGQVAAEFVIVVDECADGVGAVVAIGRARERVRFGAGADIAFDEVQERW